jgi:hypothetical protein
MDMRLGRDEAGMLRCPEMTSLRIGAAGGSIIPIADGVGTATVARPIFGGYRQAARDRAVVHPAQKFCGVTRGDSSIVFGRRLLRGDRRASLPNKIV